jgi:hypothetical protein
MPRLENILKRKDHNPMKAAYTGVLIWGKTVCLTSFMFGVRAIFVDDWSEFGMAFVILFLGLLFTLPLLLVIIPLVDLSARLPYSIHARVAWLTFYLMLIILAFYTVLGAGASSGGDKKLLQFMGMTIAGLLVAVFTTRTSLKKMYHQHDEAAQLHNVLKIINT